MYKSILTLFAVSVLLFFIGYYFVFKTEKMIYKFISLTKFKEGSYLYNQMTSQSNFIWMKIIGYGFFLFGFILFILIVLLIFRK